MALIKKRCIKILERCETVAQETRFTYDEAWLVCHLLMNLANGQLPHSSQIISMLKKLKRESGWDDRFLFKNTESFQGFIKSYAASMGVELEDRPNYEHINHIDLIMKNGFIIGKNSYLKRDTTGYYHLHCAGFGQPGNPDFLDTLKNDFASEPDKNLVEARDRVVEILMDDIPEIVEEESLSNCTLVGVPRAKSLKSLSDSQLLFKKAVKNAADSLDGVIDGTDCIRRVVNTRTTHLQNATEIPNDGDEPYPGITVATCEIDKDRIISQNIILIDDIYTSNVNIVEDCIQALFDNGANNVVFYTIGYTRKTQ